MGKKKKKARELAKAEHATVGHVARAADTAPVAFLGKASDVADQPPLVALSLATIAVGVVLRRRDVTRTGARMLLAHALATAGKTVLKRAIDRSRPRRSLRDGQHHAGSGSGSDDTDLNSFPSGHTAGAVSVAEAIAQTAPGYAGPARGGAAIVAAVQLPRGAHYPSDVAVGAGIGWVADRLAGMAVDAAERAIDRHLKGNDEDRAIEEAEAHPS